MIWAGQVVIIGDKRGVYRALVGKPERERERPLGRATRRWVDNIKMDLQEMEWKHGLDISGSG
jgi:hypothetical protein